MWMQIEIAQRIRSDLEAIAPRGTVRLEIHPEDRRDDPSARARVSLVLRDAARGNTVFREADEATVAADILADARRDLAARGNATKRRIASERAPS